LPITTGVMKDDTAVDSWEDTVAPGGENAKHFKLGYLVREWVGVDGEGR
jgi:hypothetical protein